MANPSEQPSQPQKHEDVTALEQLFAEHRARLCRMVALRLDLRLRGRLDASDVIQEAYLEAAQRYSEYLREPTLTPYLWLRFLTMQQLLIQARRHLKTQARDARREVPLGEVNPLEVSSANLADVLLDSITSPSSAVARIELQTNLQAALQTLDPLDREVVALRHFEYLDNAEAAQVLGIQPGAASQRYYRALKRLKGLLTDLGWDGMTP